MTDQIDHEDDFDLATQHICGKQHENSVTNDIDCRVFFAAQVNASASGRPLPSHRVSVRDLRLSRLNTELAAHGLALRGAFAVRGDDAVPQIRDGVPAATLALVGNVGSSMWPQFATSPEYRDGAPGPLDRWSRRIGDAVATHCGASALYPFGGPPHHPFLRWAARAEPTHPSPLGLSIHPVFGLWHAYRFALAFDRLPDDLDAAPEHASPCLDCIAQPCLDACPVGAFTGTDYLVSRCAAHLRATPDGDCMRLGCAARHACPVGAPFRYNPDHAAFHMRAFVAVRKVE
ncbi:MAG TPA: hypothetical protein VJ698_21965 [Noviherbaspirillum sp.]|uniref:hypothetical protein n=1 Tax=Noviherbaspirillum sp. TaxID=1926288 RepID=UPI002B49158A|nr:hypothetical protein [Noviherbaspirillum sp.]HJV88152.1 hypothetical protein [Noviherbaspirillum sp.]